VGPRLQFPPLKKLLSKDGAGVDLLQGNDLLKNPALAATLEQIAQHGANVLYRGPLTAGFMDDLQKAGAIITEKDLEEYKATLRTPLVGKDVGEFTLVGSPHPARVVQP